MVGKTHPDIRRSYNSLVVALASLNAQYGELRRSRIG
jgi:hypothetical protein